MKSKILFVAFLICLSLVNHAQDLKSQLFVNEGIIQMQSGNLHKADTLFNSALDFYPNVDAYFNKALARLNMKDECGFCENMYMASFYGDLEADSLYQKYCVSTTKMLVSKYDSLVPLILNKQYEIIETDKCGQREKIDFYNKNDSLLACLQIIKGRYYYSKLSYKARYPGGQEMLDKFISNNLVYPEEAFNDSLQGTVYASFVINEEGRVLDARIVDGVHPLLDAAALEVIRSIPKFYPATDKGKPKREIVTLNVSFAF
jgi:periplasmic protein TonB